MVLNEFSAKGLSLERLQTFLSVIEKGSIKAAANDDRVQQSNMSRQITDLEKAVGVRLFERRSRNLIPTKQAHELAVLVKAFFAGLSDLHGQANGVLQVAGGESAFEEFVWPIFGRLQRRFASTHFEFHGTPSSEAVAMIGEGRADLALVREEELNDKQHYWKILGDLPMFLVVRRDKLHKGEVARFEVLKRHGIPFLKHGGEMLKCLKEIAKQHNFQLEIAVEADSFHHAFELLRGGGVNAGILPRHLAKALPKQTFAVTAFNDERLTRRIAIACNKRAANIRRMLFHAVDTWVDVVKSV